MQSVAELAKKTGEVALRILDGEKPGDIEPSFVVPGSPMFDWRIGGIAWSVSFIHTLRTPSDGKLHSACFGRIAPATPKAKCLQKSGGKNR